MGNIDESAILTVQEVSEYLKLSESTVYRLAKEGGIPGRKIGGKWRFSREGIDAWIMQPSDDLLEARR